MKKKIAIRLTYLNYILLLILWGVSITLTFYLLTIFGWKINHNYDKNKEKQYRKRIDILCHIILCIWCLFGILNLVLYGPFYILIYAAQNIVYIILTLLTMTIWLDRKYHTGKNYRNFLVVVSIWNIVVYLMTLIQLITIIRMNDKLDLA